MATANRYRVVKGGSFRGQQGNVWSAIQKSGPTFTVAEIVPVLSADPTFSTTQTVERIAAYYVCVLKKSGHIAVADSAVTVSLAEFYAAWEAEQEETV